MPLVYRDARVPRSSTHRLPAWLQGQPGLQRAQADAGDFVGVWDAEIFHPDHLPADTVWHDVGDDWRVCLVGALVPSTLLRATFNLPKVLPVQDREGRIWHVPAVLAPDPDPSAPQAEAGILLSLPWGRTEAGAVGRVPTAEQARLIETARAARREIQGNTLKDVPIDVAAAWLGELFGAVYHLDLVVLLKLGVVDDDLCVRAVMAAAGYYGTKAT